MELKPILRTFALGLGACAWLVAMAGKTEASPPAAPLGYEWQALPALFDEFNEAALDGGKWLNHHPYWSGRDSTFDTNKVWLADGNLVLQSTGTATNDIRAACVSSTTRAAGASGYYEASLKAAKLSMTSSFWFQGSYSEIDVIENNGGSTANPAANYQMRMNTHYFPGGFANDTNTPASWTMPSGCETEFHTYGVWWKDSRHVSMYHNGTLVTNLTTGGDFLESQYLFFDTEVFVWDGWPTLASLQDPTRNKMLVDWVRAWQLAPVGGPPPASPTGLSAVNSPTNQVCLSWNASARAAGFDVKRAATNGGTYTNLATALRAATFIDTNLPASGTYYYVVSAVNKGGESPDSAPVAVAVSLAEVAAPVVSIANSSVEGTLELRWSPTNWVLYSTTTLTPTNWVPVLDATSPYLFAPTNHQLLFRIYQPLVNH